MIDYGLKGRVVLITGVNNPQGIGATTALAFAREEAKLVLVYKKINRSFDKDKTSFYHSKGSKNEIEINYCNDYSVVWM